MTKQTKETGGRHEFEDEFAGLPLEEKIAALLRMEIATFGETLSFIADSSAKAMERAGEFVHNVGEKIETEVKKAAAGASCAESSTQADSDAQATGNKGDAGTAAGASAGKRKKA